MGSRWPCHQGSMGQVPRLDISTVAATRALRRPLLASDDARSIVACADTTTERLRCCAGQPASTTQLAASIHAADKPPCHGPIQSCRDERSSKSSFHATRFGWSIPTSGTISTGLRRPCLPTRWRYFPANHSHTAGIHRHGLQYRLVPRLRRNPRSRPTGPSPHFPSRLLCHAPPSTNPLESTPKRRAGILFQQLRHVIQPSPS